MLVSYHWIFPCQMSVSFYTLVEADFCKIPRVLNQIDHAHPFHNSPDFDLLMVCLKRNFGKEKGKSEQWHWVCVQLQ